jgi:KUP system potassium uptake protein
MSAVVERAHTIAPVRHGLTLAALGVVYGDLGTSPLYAVNICFDGPASVSEPRVFGTLSLIAWALILVVTLKYVIVLLRADNRGEGGIIALMALALRAARSHKYRWMLPLGLLGAAMFYGDGVLTPAISVLAAVEGLTVAEPAIEPYLVPFALVLLIALFLVQRHGTSRVGAFFGPIIAVWFATIGLLGLRQIVLFPGIVRALDPIYGIRLLLSEPGRDTILIGAVVLAVTGAEALYADMGHFGPGPIKRAWLRFVFPALLLNYFGQGALLLADPDASGNPFFLLAPHWAVYPLVALASAAAVIASQAVITGAFSLTRQAVQLGYLPRLLILHTSEHEVGQVYVPVVNTILLLAVAATVVTFRSSEALAAGYGLAVIGTMLITTVLAVVYLRLGAGWKLWKLLPLFGFFALIDVAFLGVNLLKIPEGGWFPLTIGGIAYAGMMIWVWGRKRIAAQQATDDPSLADFLATFQTDWPRRVPGTGVYMTVRTDRAPAALRHKLRLSKVLHQRNVLMTVRTEDVPRIADADRLDIRHLEQNFHSVTISYGFFEEPNIPHALDLCRDAGLPFDLTETTFYIGRQKLVLKPGTGLALLAKRIFARQMRLALDATEFFHIPVDRVVEIGGQIEL